MKPAVPTEAWRRNQLVMTAVVFVVFTGFAFVLPFLPLYVRELGVQGEEQVAGRHAFNKAQNFPKENPGIGANARRLSFLL